jgi:hypothetical protein
MWHGRPASAALRLPPSGVLWLAPEGAPKDEIGAERAADIGQAAPVAPFAPEVVGDTTPADVAVPDSPAGLADMPELRSGDGTLTDDVDPAYLPVDGGPSTRHGGGGARSDEVPAAHRPGRVRSEAEGEGWPGDDDTDVDPGLLPSATDADAPGDAPANRVARHADLLDTAPSAGVAADAPVVAPEVPEVEVGPLGTAPDQVPPDAAVEDEPPAMELTLGGAEAVLDEPRSGSDVTATPVAVGGGSPVSAMPSASRPADRDDESSTHQ